MDLTNVNELKALLKKHSVWAQKKLGQNFLIRREPLSAIITASNLTAQDTIVEVGAGCGVLTTALAPHVGTVHAVELDAEIIPVLREVTGEFSNIVIHQQDIRTFVPPREPYKVIANIPYYLTGKLFRYFLEEVENIPLTMVLMTQKEVAEKVTALPPHANLLSTAVGTFGLAEIIAMVSAESFYPVPKVDSAIVRVTVRPADIHFDNKKYFRIVRAAFGQPRKQIHNGLSANLRLTTDDVRTWLTQCSIDPARRPGTLTVEEWRCLANNVPTSYS